MVRGNHFAFTDQPGRTHLEFSLDGGNTYKAQVADNSGSVSYTVTPASYDLYVRWGDISCPTSLGTKTVAVAPAPEVSSIATEDVDCDTGKGKITFNFTDVPSRTGIEFSLDGGNTYKAQVNDNSGSVSYEVDAGTYPLFVRWGNNQCPVDLGSKTILEDCNNPPPNGECFVVSNTDQVSIEAEDFSRANPGTGNAASTSWTELLKLMHLVERPFKLALIRDFGQDSTYLDLVWNTTLISTNRTLLCLCSLSRTYG